MGRLAYDSSWYMATQKELPNLEGGLRGERFLSKVWKAPHIHTKPSVILQGGKGRANMCHYRNSFRW